jgi:hypothetical protein
MRQPCPRCSRNLRKAFLLLLALGGCAVQNHAPPFANLPYAPFSRSAAVAVATDEWRLWGNRVGLTPDYKQTEVGMGERQQGLWQRVGEYWWEGMNTGEPDAAFTGKHDAQGHVFPITVDTRYAWSAAFISYVMRTAGAGRDFPYSPDHATYINYAARAAEGKMTNPLLIAENPASYAPRLGDLACFARGKAHRPTFAELPTAYDFPAHCGIVVAASPNDIDIISGNVDDAVVLQHVATDAQGLLTDTPQNWLVVLRVLYSVE